MNNCRPFPQDINDNIFREQSHYTKIRMIILNYDPKIAYLFYLYIHFNVLPHNNINLMQHRHNSLTVTTNYFFA